MKAPILFQKSPIAQRSAATQGIGQVDNRIGTAKVRQLQAAVGSSPRQAAQRNQCFINSKQKVVQRVFVFKNTNATSEMVQAYNRFYKEISTGNGSLFKLASTSPQLNVVIEPQSNNSIPGSGETILEREDDSGNFNSIYIDINECHKDKSIKDVMRQQKLTLRIKVDQIGLANKHASAMQILETLLHEYYLHAEANETAIRVLLSDVSNQLAYKLIENDYYKGGFHNADMQHDELTKGKGGKFDRMNLAVHQIAARLPIDDSKELLSYFIADQKDNHEIGTLNQLGWVYNNFKPNFLPEYHRK